MRPLSLNAIGLCMFLAMWLQLRFRWLNNDNPWHVAYFFTYMLAAIILAAWKETQ